MADQLVMGDPTAPRFVYWQNKLRATPSGPASAVFGDFLSFLGKIRAGLGAVGLFKRGAPEKEESVKEFISRNLGPEVFFRLIEPFCSGVYAGDPAKLSMRAAFGRIHVLEGKGGSLVGGALALAKERKANPPPPRPEKLPPKPGGQTVASFSAGLQTLPKAIADKVQGSVVCDWRLTDLQRGADGDYELTYDTPDGARTIRARTVGLTAPSYVVADLLQSRAPKAAESLQAIDYPPVCAVTVAYPESAVKVRTVWLSCDCACVRSACQHAALHLHQQAPWLQHCCSLRLPLQLKPVQPCPHRAQSSRLGSSHHSRTNPCSWFISVSV